MRGTSCLRGLHRKRGKPYEAPMTKLTWIGWDIALGTVPHKCKDSFSMSERSDLLGSCTAPAVFSVYAFIWGRDLEVQIVGWAAAKVCASWQ